MRSLPRAMKNVIDHVEPKQMYELLETRCDTEFCYIVGIIADLKQSGARISNDHEKILKIPQMLLNAALRNRRGR
jgi:hypothetical protein